MKASAFRKNYLPTLSATVYIVTLLLLLSELDRQYYQREKEAVIKYNFGALFPHDTARLQKLSGQILVRHAAGEGVDSEMEGAWREEAQRMLAGEGCVYRIRIVPKDEPELLVLADHAKFDRLNGWANTLFYRNFQNVVSYEIAGTTGQPWIGLLSFHYTTPEDYGLITTLTNRYRLFALLIFSLVTAGYALVMVKLILPVKRVVSRIDAAVSSAPALMLRPASMLERAYNNLARDAILLRVGQSLRGAAAESPSMGRAELLEAVPGLLVELLGYHAVVLCDVTQEQTGRVTVSDGPAITVDQPAPACREHCRQHVFTANNLQAAAGVPVAVGEWILSRIAEHEDRRHATYLAVLPPRDTRGAASELRQWNLVTVAQLARQLHDLLEAFELQRRHVRSERSRANINLARNLGHDLTNIIATSKLDIMTARKLLDGVGTVDADAPTRMEMLRESVQGLLDSARLQQEVVNIYRSFSYINRPKFEKRQINEVLDEMIEVFSLSLPSRTSIRRDYASGLPACVVEPRLLKLAVFNLLTNAVQAIKQNIAEGEIAVSTAMANGGDRVRIAVRDNGTGIRTAEGKLATQAEIDSVFRYGVSTKTGDGGEGLGLSWVWTIVEEFHNGNVEARNHPDGGAEFIMSVSCNHAEGGSQDDG